MRATVKGIEAIEWDETAYWPGVAIHRPKLWCAWTALRVLLTERRPRQRRSGETLGHERRGQREER